MSEPLSVECDDAGAILEIERIRHLATVDQRLVLRFPSGFDDGSKREVRDALKARLPEFSVFDSGAHTITVKQVVSRDDVLANANVLVEAARRFRETARALVERLAAKKRVPPGELCGRAGGSGRLDREWRYAFHGLQCRFENRKTKQVLEVEIAYGDEFGVLDPWFFAQFVQTTPEFTSLRRLFRDAYHDGRRILEVLEAEGHLMRTSRKEFGPKTGVFAP